MLNLFKKNIRIKKNKLNNKKIYRYNIYTIWEDFYL